MNKFVQMIAALGLVGFISGASLALVHKYATPLIEANEKNKLEMAIFKIIPNGTMYEVVTKDGETFFKAYDRSGNMLAYVFIAEGNGYQGNIKVMAGIKKDLSAISDIEILESIETPGLGGEITSEKFMDQFKNLRFLPKIECVKKEREDKNEIQAITGATISSQSVTDILNEKIAKLIKILER